jgi:hypothetical protein
VLLHPARIGNDDVPAFPFFEGFKVKGNLISGFWHLGKYAPILVLSLAGRMPKEVEYEIPTKPSSIDTG